MLISFSLANFRSFKHKQTIDLTLATKLKKTHPSNIFATPNKQVPKLLKSVALYGPNASGKSNLIKGFCNCYSMIIANQRQRGDKILLFEPFLLDDKADCQPTEYEIDFIASNDVRYVYSFAFDANKIHYERLESYENKKSSTKKLIYEIGFEKDEIYHKKLLEESNLFDRIKENINIFKNTKNNLFLNININNGSSMFNPVYDWFKNSVDAMFNHDDYAINSFLWIKENKEKLLKLIKKFDLSIVDIDIIERETNLPSNIAENQNIPQELKNRLRKTYQPNFIHKTNEGKAKIFATNQISEGTLNLITLVPQLFKILNIGGILFFDELDRSIHPDILVELVKMFHDTEINQHNAQLVFTAHNDILLDKNYNLFSRDQVWFASKDDVSQSSQLYCLKQFNNKRSSENIASRYRDFEYGARPFIAR